MIIGTTSCFELNRNRHYNSGVLVFPDHTWAPRIMLKSLLAVLAGPLDIAEFASDTSRPVQCRAYLGRIWTSVSVVNVLLAPGNPTVTASYGMSSLGVVFWLDG
jgi:hypothetical protein